MNYFHRFSSQLDYPGLCALLTEGRVGLEESQHRDHIRDFLALGVGRDRSVNRDVFPKLDLTEFQRVARDFPLLLEEIASGEFDSYIDFVGRLIGSQFKPDDIVVLNNDPPAHYFSASRRIAGAMAVFVTRDIRDTLSDRPKFKTKQGPHRAAYVFEHALRLRWHQERLRNLQATWITFDEFVSSAETRGELLFDILGCAPSEGVSTFSEAESSQNVGIFRAQFSNLDMTAFFLACLVANTAIFFYRLFLHFPGRVLRVVKLGR